MSLRTSFGCVAIALASLGVTQDGLSAQVVEAREGDSNPSAALFKATLFGAGTGLLVGGAYALMNDADQDETIDALKWGFVAGVGGGLAIGLIYMAVRDDPEENEEVIGSLLRLEDGSLRVAAPRLGLARQIDDAGRPRHALRADLLQVRF